MKIGILVWELNVNGGTQRQALELAKNLQDIGEEVIVYSFYFDDKNCYPDLCSLLEIKYIKKRRFRPNNKLGMIFYTLIKYVLFFFEVRQRTLLKIISIDLDILNAHDCQIYPTAAMWKKKTSKPVIWMMNDMPMYKNNFRKPLKTVLYYIKPKFRKYIRSFDKVLVLDNFNKKRLQLDLNITAEIIRSGLDINKITYNTHPVKDKFVLLSIGSFLPYRRIEDSIFALNILIKKGYRIMLVHIGNNNLNFNYSKKIYGIVRKLRLELHINFYRSVSNDQLLEYYHDANLFLFPNAPQTWGLAVFEAMACGLPVIMTNGCGASEIIENNVHAKIVKPFRPDLIANAIEEFYDKPEFREYVGKNGRIFVEKELSWLKYTKNMLTHYHNVLSLL